MGYTIYEAKNVFTIMKLYSLRNGLEINLVEQRFTAGGHLYSMYRIYNLDELVDQLDEEDFKQDERMPYWAELWPSAVGLSNYIAANPQLISNKTVLELGCGLGFTSMVIARQNPEELLITDYEQDALELTRMNFALNGMGEPHLQILDWRGPNLEKKYEVLIAADILYEERFFGPLFDLFFSSLEPGGKIILAEPNRKIAAEFFTMLKNRGFFFGKETFNISHDALNTKVDIYQIKRAVS